MSTEVAMMTAVFLIPAAFVCSDDMDYTNVIFICGVLLLMFLLFLR